MEPQSRDALHGLGALASTWSCVAWCGFALAAFPWIVPADAMRGAATEAERQAVAGGLLALLALGGVPLYGGGFGRGPSARIVAGLLAAAVLTAGLPLQFASAEAPVALGWRLAHLALAALFAGIALPPLGRSTGRGIPPNG